MRMSADGTLSLCVCVCVFAGEDSSIQRYLSLLSGGEWGHVIVTGHRDEQADASYEHSPAWRMTAITSYR